MSDNGYEADRESDWDTLKYWVRAWWHGGESGRQKLRRAAGVYRASEGFDKSDQPKFHWTALVFRAPFFFVQTNFGSFLVALLAAIAAIAIQNGWFVK